MSNKPERSPSFIAGTKPHPAFNEEQCSS